MSILSICSIACMTRLDFVASLSCSSLLRIEGMIWQDSPYLSLSRPHRCFGLSASVKRDFRLPAGPSQATSGIEVSGAPDMGRRIVKVSDAMQKGYRYELTAPVGRNFDPEIPAGADAERNASPRRLLRKIHDGHETGISRELVRRRQARRGTARLRAELFRRRCQPALVGVAPEGMDPSGRSARLVSMVLPLLHGPSDGGGRPAADQALEGDAPAHPAN